MSLATRIYAEVQEFITDSIANEQPPKMRDIGEKIFGKRYDVDSMEQRSALYTAITRGRNAALQEWDLYCQSGSFRKDIENIEFYHTELIDNEEKSNDFSEFNWHLYRGKFGNHTKNIKEFITEYTHIAVIWSIQLKDYSKKGINLVIASYGKESVWFIPSWWRWAVRETDLYKRSLDIIVDQLNRGISTQIALPSGRQIERAVGLTGSVRAYLEDGTSWTCRTCGMVNLGTSNNCSNCGAQKT